MFNIVAVLLILFNKNLFSQELKICTTTSSTRYNVQWPSTNNCTISNPPCVNQNKEFAIRKCSDGVWDPEPECDYVQEKNPTKCPDDFVESEEYDFCYQISKHKTKFPPECLYKDVPPFESYRNLIDNNGPFWMPVARNFDNDFGLFQWLETSYLYKTAFEGRYYHDGTSKNKNCLLYYNSSYIEAVSCDEEHLSICVYKKFDQIVDSLCSSEDFCAQSDFINKTKCFCTDTEDSDYPKAEFLQLYQNNVIAKLTNDSCSIGLEIANGTYIWSGSKHEINYTFWSTDVIFDNEHIHGASTPNGWILTENLTSCSLIEKDIDIRGMEPHLNLLYSSLEPDLLNLMILNPKTLKKNETNIFLYCFTDASANTLLYRYQNLTKHENVYSFQRLEDGCGNYWCESFDSVKMKIVRSNKLFLEEPFYSFEFVTIARVNYTEDMNFDLIRDNLFMKLYQNEHLKQWYTLRIMKLADVDESRRRISVNIHLSTRELDASLHDQEFYRVKAIIENTQIEMESFLSTSYCMKESGFLSWEKTGAGSEASSEEYCFKSDGTLMTRWCSDDFINGAQWAPITETCEIAQNSIITQEILNLDVSSSLQPVLQILKKHEQFCPLDIYLLVKRLKSHSLLSETDDEERFAQIIDNLMDIDRDLLIESQSKMKATDNLLYNIYMLLRSVNDNDSRICHKNFFIEKISKLKNIKTVAKLSVKKHFNNDPCAEGIITLTTNGDAEEPTEDLESEILLTSDIQDFSIVSPDYGAIFLIFFKNSFFTNIKSPNTNTISKVFRVMLPGLPFGEPLSKPFLFVQNVVDSNMHKNCSVWDFLEKTGSWRNSSTSENSDSVQYQQCEFWETPYFAMTEVVTVTESLIEILESNSSAPEIIAKLEEISSRYQEFVSIDVFLTGQILKKVHKDDGIDLEILAETINNIHKIEREILEESQMRKRATDDILYYLDRIIINHKNHSVQAISDHFMILISDTKENNFSGVALLKINETVQVQILEGEIDVEEVSNNENLQSALLLSPELKSQLDEDSRVIVTFFSTDALFNERRPRNVSKIFGVILPDIGEYSGPVSTLQRVEKNQKQEQCVHWNYNLNIAGAWFKDQESQELSSLIECQFWHTTHFAVLIMDEDGYKENKVLDWITNINCSLSLFGLSCIFLTAIVSKKWRQNSGNKILLNFTFAMMLQIIFFYIAGSVKNYLICSITGVLLHYSVISEFCWMLVIAYLQHRRFVKVLGGPPQHILLKGCLLGWVLPVFPVIFTSVLENFDYTNRKVGICYPSGLGLYIGVWLPVSVAVLVNFVIFASIIYNVFRKKTDCVGKEEMIFQWRLAFLLFFMLGMSWIFGFLSELEFGIVFVYLFSATATLQGFVVFLFFIALNANVKDLYLRNMKKCRKDF